MDATVWIDSDPATLGEAATEKDVERYAENLAAHLSERFGLTVAVRTQQTLRGASCFENIEIQHYVRELHAGDGWLQFVD